jgi:hypothetical protein
MEKGLVLVEVTSFALSKQVNAMMDAHAVSAVLCFTLKVTVAKDARIHQTPHPFWRLW